MTIRRAAAARRAAGGRWPAAALAAAIVVTGCGRTPWKDPDLASAEAAAAQEQATVLDRRGARELLERRFAELDTDGDGEVSAIELMRAGHTYLEKADRNRDGRLSRREFLDHHMSRFDVYDRNDDGELQANEYRQWGLD